MTTSFSESLKDRNTEIYTYSDGRVATNIPGYFEVKRANVTKSDSTRRRKPTGWLYPLPYSFSKEVVIKKRGVNSWKDAFGTKVSIDGWDPVNGASSQLPSHALPTQPYIDKAVTNALTKLKAQRVNIATNLVEARMTADLIGTTAARLAQAYRYIRNGHYEDSMRILRVAKREGRNTPRTWLELQYGWKPLLMDVHGAVQALKEKHDVRGWVTTVKGGSGYTEEIQSGIFNPSSDWPASYHATRKLGVYVRLDYIPTNDVLQHVASLGLTNPLEVLWEEVPYSFIVDWFLPIGNWLHVLDATLGFTFLSGSCSVLWDTKGHWTGLPAADRYEPRYNSMQIDFWKKDLTRSVYGSSPLPYLPRLKNPLSLQHMANGLSLLSQAFGRKR